MSSVSSILEQWCNEKLGDDYELHNENLLMHHSQQKALILFHEAAARIPAYNDFLKSHGIASKDIKTIVDFQHLPVITKENYIDQYPLSERILLDNSKNITTISTSSGTSGKPYLWPRDIRDEIDGAKLHELILSSAASLDKKTLFINGFALGNWIAGTFTQICIWMLSLKGYPITIMSPGYSLEAVLDVLASMNNGFDQIIIAGHIPFLKEVVEAARENKLIYKKQTYILLGTGQAITESWRDYILDAINGDSPTQVINLYGSADAALMGFETQDSIAIRRKLTNDPDRLSHAFNSNRIPSLYNYDPRSIYFESVKNELHITKYGVCPLIRYNMHDNGGVIRRRKFKDKFGLLDASENNNQQKYYLPFVYLFGRDKFMAKIYGANVYTEHVQAALNNHKLQSILTGRFLMETIIDENNNPRLICRVQLSEGVNSNEELADLVREIFIEEVAKVNSEYSYVLSNMGDKAKPKIVLHEHHDNEYFPKDKIKKTA